MSYLLGIDLGVARTSAALALPGGGPGDVEVVDLGGVSGTISSDLFVGADGSVLVGEEAGRAAVGSPQGLVSDAVRRVGDPLPVWAAGLSWSPQDLAARVVRWVVERAAAQDGPAARIAVAHPTTWGAPQRDLLAGALAGHGVQAALLPAPAAAAWHLASSQPVDGGLAVLRIGTSSADVALVLDDGGFAIAGRPEPVGIAVDALLTDLVRAQLSSEWLDDAQLIAVRVEAARALDTLASEGDATIGVPMRGVVRVQRSELDALLRPRLAEAVEALRRTVGSASLTLDRVPTVLLVGAGARLPVVARAVGEALGRAVTVADAPEHAAALGAARSLDARSSDAVISSYPALVPPSRNSAPEVVSQVSTPHQPHHPESPATTVLPVGSGHVPSARRSPTHSGAHSASTRAHASGGAHASGRYPSHSESEALSQRATGPVSVGSAAGPPEPPTQRVPTQPAPGAPTRVNVPPQRPAGYAAAAGYTERNAPYDSSQDATSYEPGGFGAGGPATRYEEPGTSVAEPEYGYDDAPPPRREPRYSAPVPTPRRSPALLVAAGAVAAAVVVVSVVLLGPVASGNTAGTSGTPSVGTTAPGAAPTLEATRGNETDEDNEPVTRTRQPERTTAPATTTVGVAPLPEVPTLDPGPGPGPDPEPDPEPDPDPEPGTGVTTPPVVTTTPVVVVPPVP